MSNEKIFVYDEDGLFEIADDAECSLLMGGIQTTIGSAGIAQVGAGVFCSNKDSCS